MIPLLAFRHAAPVSSGVCYGRLDVEVALTPDEAAEIVLAQLKDATVRAVWSSPALRCSGPAQRVAARLSAPLHVDDRLQELSFGAWEGRRWDEIPRADLDSWASDWYQSAPPGGESARDLELRVRAWLAERDPVEPIAVIAHAGVLRALDVLLAGKTWEQALAEPVPYLMPRSFG